MSELIGEVRMFAGGFVPRGWLECDGRQLSVHQNPGLFSVLQNRFGGNGTTTFRLPDLRGRAPVGTGKGQTPELSPRSLGDSFGTEQVTLKENQIPTHRHQVRVSQTIANSPDPDGRYLARRASGVLSYASGGAGPTLHDQTITTAGGGASHSNMQPSLALTFIICVEGLLPADITKAGTP